MALAYPQGECFFNKKGLDSDNQAWYQASNPDRFYSHFMLEYIWNKAQYHAVWDSKHSHHRSTYKEVKGSFWNTWYGCWSGLPIMYGDRDNARYIEHRLCTNGNIFRDHEKGQAAKAWFMTMPMSTLEERYIYIDRLAWIRSIYIPLTHTVNERFPELCGFVHVNFAFNGPVRFWWEDEHNSYWDTTHLDKTTGLCPSEGWTLVVDVPKFVGLLSMPRQLRGGDAFSTKALFMLHTTKISTKTANPERVYNGDPDFEWTKVANANFGLQLQWKTPENPDWWLNHIKTVITAAVGFIPVVGFFVSTIFPVYWVAVFDPDKFEDTLREAIPGVDINIRLYKLIKEQFTDTHKLLEKEWQNNYQLVGGAWNPNGNSNASKKSVKPVKLPAGLLPDPQFQPNSTLMKPAEVTEDKTDYEVGEEKVISKRENDDGYVSEDDVDNDGYDWADEVEGLEDGVDEELEDEDD